MIEAVIVNGKADADKKSCYDCYYCQAAVSWWCVNDEAISYRNTRFVGVHGCQFWKAARHIDDLSLLEKVIGDFIKIKGKE